MTWEQEYTRFDVLESSGRLSMSADGVDLFESVLFRIFLGSIIISK
jgi:hypothetical protein